MKKRRIIIPILFIIFVNIILYYIICLVEKNSEVSYIYVTDLALNGDFDDFFDLAVIHKLDIKDLTIVLDNSNLSQNKEETSGKTAIENLSKAYCSKQYSVTIGKSRKFIENIDEKCTRQLVDKINQSNKTVLITVGSLRDIAAILDDEHLKRDKIHSVYIFAGDYEDTYEEYNVSLDTEAYGYVLESRVPIYLIPCFENGLWTRGINSSYFVASHKEILENCDKRLLRWFVYEYWHTGESFEDYVLSKKEKEKFYNEKRNLWCSSILPYIIECHDQSIGNNQMLEKYPFSFQKDDNYNIYRFKILDRTQYEDYSVSIINQILND